MKFQLDFQLPESSVKIKHGDKVVLIGSCFSDNLEPKFKNAGFDVLSNPLGTIFHPLALANCIYAAFNDFESTAVQRNDLWFDWRASGTLYGTSKEALDSKVQESLSKLKNQLLETKLLVVTFGTAWGYGIESGETVANCHKMPSSLFEKQLSNVQLLLDVWNDVLSMLQSVNPRLQVVFTVSPVRHSKDGLIENNRSKARLLQACESLEENASCGYFPSYELVIDVLRDSRFFESDLVHPNQQAVDFVWKQAQTFFFGEETQVLVSEVEAVNRMRTHRPLHPESLEAQKFQENLKKQLAALREKHPEVYWED